jgi:hypothetical protein
LARLAAFATCLLLQGGFRPLAGCAGTMRVDGRDGSARSSMSMKSVRRRLAGMLGAVAAAGAVIAASPTDGVPQAIVVCPNPQGGCTASNHNQVLL